MVPVSASDSKIADDAGRDKLEGSNSPPSALPKRVYFTFQLFNLPPSRTSTMLLHQIQVANTSDSTALAGAAPTPTFVLMSDRSIRSASDSKTDSATLEVSAPIECQIDPTLVCIYVFLVTLDFDSSNLDVLK